MGGLKNIPVPSNFPSKKKKRHLKFSGNPTYIESPLRPFEKPLNLKPGCPGLLAGWQWNTEKRRLNQRVPVIGNLGSLIPDSAHRRSKNCGIDKKV